MAEYKIQSIRNQMPTNPKQTIAINKTASKKRKFFNLEIYCFIVE